MNFLFPVKWVTSSWERLLWCLWLYLCTIFTQGWVFYVSQMSKFYSRLECNYGNYSHLLPFLPVFIPQFTKSSTPDSFNLLWMEWKKQRWWWTKVVNLFAFHVEYRVRNGWCGSDKVTLKSLFLFRWKMVMKLWYFLREARVSMETFL